MYVAPNSIIYLLSNVGLDNSYTQTHYFESVGEQHAYFTSHAKHTLTNYSYVNQSDNHIRVNLNAEQLYTCSYMMFQNTAFGSRWFYAFITDVRYISNNCSEITFEIDVIQSWLKDFSLNPCYVAREHVTSDNLGDNINAEPIDVGELVGNEKELIYEQKYNLVIGVVNDDAHPGTMVDNTFSGSTLMAFTTNTSGIASANAYLKTHGADAKNITAIYMVPDCACNASDTGTPVSYLSLKTFQSAIEPMGTLDGYTPKNKKLYTYPYNYYRVANGNGGELNIKYEYLDVPKPLLTYSATATQPVQLGIRPNSYKNDSAFRTEVLVTTGYPVCSWANDTFSQWVATSGSNQMITGAINTALGLAINPAVGVIAGVRSIGSVVGGALQATKTTNTQQGSATSGGVNLSKSYGSIYGTRMSVTSKTAKVIDDFFTRYGYAINEIKQPNVVGRKAFNYVQTVDCTIRGSVFGDDAKKICDIHNKGIAY